ncbi:MAG: NAD(P)-dependent oxidoreductase, partial [Chloroflexia bacterium]|nr:NAD(P)-dependent oxidoreductase [Chloroflexia bacterium]
LGGVEIDLLDVGQVAWAMAGHDAVIHLGAIPSPGRQADQVIFRNNTGSTFAVLQAASLLGIGTVANASSLSALGTAWAPVAFAPRYAPVDEDHPLLNHDPYGLSKEVDERTGEMFHRRAGMQVVAMRFPWVATPGEIAERTRSPMEPSEEARTLWSYIDIRDAATFCRLAIGTRGLGFVPVQVTAVDTLSDTPTEDLLRAHAPETEIRSPIPGTATAFSLDRAREVLGFEPRHSWRDG